MKYNRYNIIGTTFCSSRSKPKKGQCVYTITGFDSDTEATFSYEDYLTGENKGTTTYSIDTTLRNYNNGDFYVLNSLANLEIY